MWSPGEYEDALRAEVSRMAASVRGADLKSRVPTCPDWDVAELVEHTGTVHRWAATMVRERASERLNWSDVDLALPADRTDSDAYAGWLAAGADLLGGAFAATDPDTEMWAWGADPHARFWSRRMLHETTVHRVDADLARGDEPTVDGRAAADGIDELLTNLPRARYFRPRVAELRGAGESLLLRSTDRDEAWTILLVEDGFEWQRGDGEATVTVAAPTETLFLVLYARRAPADARVTITGDGALLARWLEASAL